MTPGTGCNPSLACHAFENAPRQLDFRQTAGSFPKIPCCARRFACASIHFVGVPARTINPPRPLKQAQILMLICQARERQQQEERLAALREARALREQQDEDYRAVGRTA
jgi:hypothetical protein